MKFTKNARLLSKSHYQRVLRAGKRFTGLIVIIDYRKGNHFCPQLGITISRRYGKAHLRNRFKRVTREAFRLSAHCLPSNLEINISPRHALQQVSREDILNDLTQLLTYLYA